MRLPIAFAVLLSLLVPASAWAEPATKAPAEPSKAEVSEARSDDAKATEAKSDKAKPDEVEPDKAKPEQPKAPPAGTPEEKPLDKKAPDPKAPKTRPANPIEKIKEGIKEKEEEFPSPAELMRKMKAERDKRAQMPKVVYFDLSERSEERRVGKECRCGRSP